MGRGRPELLEPLEVLGRPGEMLAWRRKRRVKHKPSGSRAEAERKPSARLWVKALREARELQEARCGKGTLKHGAGMSSTSVSLLRCSTAPPLEIVVVFFWLVCINSHATSPCFSSGFLR